MELRKNYIRPFWWLLVLALIKLVFFLYIWNILSQRSFTRVQLSSILPEHIIVVALLFAETTAYWFMRKLQYQRLLAKWHVGLWYAAILVVPLAWIIVQYASLRLSPDAHLQAVQWLRIGTNIFEWSCFIIGHIFFIGAIMEGIKNRKKEEPSETSEILGSV